MVYIRIKDMSLSGVFLILVFEDKENLFSFKDERLT